MRRTVFVLILLLCSVFAGAQNVPATGGQEELVVARIAEQLGLTDRQSGAITRVYRETAAVIREADLELDIYKAQLAKLMYPADVDMKEIEELLRSSYEWHLRKQIAQIRRQVEIRQILGDEKWTQYSRIIRNMEQRSSARQGN